jgi:membrane carboxypeptidase/penicillin-binding protein
VQDRTGKVIFRADTRPCEGCNAKDWNGKPMPRPRIRQKQLMDPLTAYQVVHILEGVVQRGTAQTLRELNRPLFGKTGTTTGPTNVWFVGGSPDLVAGVYLGYDQPRPSSSSSRSRRSKGCRSCRSAHPPASAWSASIGHPAARCSAPGRPTSRRRP